MRPFLLIMLAATFMLSGCIVVSDRDWDESHNDGWRERQQTNREFIADLQPGVDVELVKDTLGNADLSEAYFLDEQSVLVLRYRTQHNKSDGETDLDETTPLIFVDNILVGWGEHALADYR